MKKLLTVCISSVLLCTLSGCTLGEITEYFLSSESSTTENLHPETARVYMGEINGTLTDFTGHQISLLCDSETYYFDVSQATLECTDGMVCGDAVSVIYEGQLNSTDTGTVRALKVVDDLHNTEELEEKTTRGQIQSLSANAVTVRSKGGKTVTFPITGTEQYYQSGLKTGIWVYLHYKGDFGVSISDDPNVLNGTHLKILSVSDIDPLVIPEATPTPTPKKGKKAKKENKMRAIISNIQNQVLQVSVENTSVMLNLDLSAIPCYFSGGIIPGSHVTVTYTGDFNGSTLEGITVTGVTGEIPEKMSERVTGFTISGNISASTANTITILTTDGVNVTCNIENASNESTGGLLTGSSVKVTFNPADSRQSNIYNVIKIEDL